MRNIKLLFGFIYFMSLTCLAQISLPAEEHFNYETGSLSSVSTFWDSIGTGTDIQVVSGNLTYTGYDMPATGNMCRFQSAAPVVIDTLNFSPVSQAGNKVYASFLINLSGSGGMTTGGTYFFGLANSGLGIYSGALLRIWIRTNGSNFNFGLSKNIGGTDPSIVWASGNYAYNNTILLVCNYEIVSGAANDSVRLWINPDLSGAEPIPDLVTTSVNADGAISNFYIRQLDESPIGNIDAIRIATSWSQAPLPVELSEFSASSMGSSVQLKWRTETEVNNYGFEVERKIYSSTSMAATNWEKIGFLIGNGNSNSPKYYVFEDRDINTGKYFYRLKQIDNDGKFEYSKVIEVKIGTKNQYNLSQNYPNPFNPITSITYSLAKAGNIKLIVYNLLGQEIKILENGYKEPGTYTLDFDASQLESGIYIYKLETGSYSQTKKMILLR